MVEQWLALNYDESLKLQVLHAAFANQGGVLPAYDKDARIAAVVDFSMRAARRNRLDADKYTEKTRSANSWLSKISPNGRLVPRAVWSVVSASFVALLGFVGIQEYRSRSETESGKVGSIPMLAYSTGNAERRLVTLPDGSTAMLNVGSRLEIPADYHVKRRGLRLTGEAVFSVQSHSDVPFTVEAGGKVARVLGTKFGVRYYPSDTAITVAVEDGRVAIESVVVSASQQATVLKNGMTQISNASEARFAFVEGVLMFDGVPLKSAVEELNRWYDVDIRISDSTLASQEIWGKFAGSSPDALIRILDMTFGVRVVRDGRVLTLHPGT